MVSTIASIAMGGALGALARYGVHTGAVLWLGASFWGTFAVNIVGSFAMGVLAVIVAQGMGEALRLFLMVGFLGAFTTFSAYSLDSVTLWHNGQSMQAAAYMIASVVGAILALLAGMSMGRVFLS